jgi:hypothetical protein
MELTDRWKAMNWQTSEFSYAKVDLLAELKKESTSDINKLLKAYKRQYVLMAAFTVITPLFALLNVNEPEYVFSIGMIWSYCLILSGFQTIQFSRFKLPDLALQTAEAIRTSLVFVRAINTFQCNFIAFYAPVVFLGSLMAALTYGGKQLATIISDPVAILIIVISTALISWAGQATKRFLASRQCVALIAKLEEALNTLEQL